MMNTQAQGLGFRREAAPRRANFPLSAQLPETIVRRNHYWPMFGLPLDQGATGTCVGHGGKHWEISVPVIRTQRLGPPTAIDLYLAATTRDPWHNGQPDTSLQDGTSVNALMLALRDQYKLIGAFDWELSRVDPVLDFLSEVGPVIIGVNWYDSMFRTDQEGFLHLPTTARIAGGHCLCINGIDIKRGFVYGPNSWGQPADFGRFNPNTGRSDGRFRMSFELLARLIGEDGEACAARELTGHGVPS